MRPVPLLTLAACYLFSGGWCNTETTTKITIDEGKPFVYVKFGHAGPRPALLKGEPTQGLWLCLVNNSVLPITVKVPVYPNHPNVTILEDVISPKMVRVKPGTPSEQIDQGPMPNGYAAGFDIAGTELVPPGKDLTFSVPINHVAPFWFLQVPFQFDLPVPAYGSQPISYAPFTWEDLPTELRRRRVARSK